MTIEKKLLGTSPSGGATDVADVFSTDLYDGKDSSQTINNGIDLAGEGGMVWQKLRVHPQPPDGQDHYLRDTVRGGGRRVYSNKTNGQNEGDGGISSFNSNGFSIGNISAGNLNGAKYASWTFRKKEKFFTCLTYSGNGVTGRQIAHDLGGPVGMILIKSTNTANDWQVWHTTTGAAGAMQLNTTAAVNNSVYWWNNTNPTSTHFTLAARNQSNNSSAQYVAYLFADNSSEDADDQMIKCGGYTGNGGTQQISLGWEPQFVMIKKTSGTSDWHIIDNMRGGYLEANTDTAEQGALFTVGETISPNANGFYLEDGSALSNTNGAVYVWMAIRAPMMKEPKAATDVFAVDNGNGSDVPAFNSGFPVDMTFWTNTGGDNRKIASRLTGGRYLETDGTGAEQADSSYAFDYQSGWYSAALASTNYSWMWKRAKGYMDVVCDKRAFTYGTLNHSLGVVPELIIKKDRSRTNYWDVMPNVSPYDYRYNLYLNDTQAISGPSSAYWNSAPTDTVFGVHYGNDGSSNGDNFVFYLFASLAGISKVGYYTGNGSSQTISCGFSAGARFVLIKRTNAAGDWYVWDSVRGIVAGNDPHLSLNTNAAQVTNDDSVDPHNSGFIVNQVAATNINVSSATYVFYAIAQDNQL